MTQGIIRMALNTKPLRMAAMPIEPIIHDTEPLGDEVIDALLRLFKTMEKLAAVSHNEQSVSDFKAALELCFGADALAAFDEACCDISQEEMDDAVAAIEERYRKFQKEQYGGGGDDGEITVADPPNVIMSLAKHKPTAAERADQKLANWALGRSGKPN